VFAVRLVAFAAVGCLVAGILDVVGVFRLSDALVVCGLVMDVITGLRPVVPERPEQDRRSGTRVSSRRSLRSPIRFRRLRMFRPKVRWMSQRSALRSQRPSLWN
jgi:hypothetical protein